VASLVGWVPEGDGVLLSSTVLDNVIVRIGGMAMTEERGLDALDLVGLTRRANEPIVHLNHAERRRVALARCLARRVPILVIDNELDSVLWPLFPMLCGYQPWIESVIVTQSALTSFTHRAATCVAVVHEGAVIAQGVLDDLVRSGDSRVRDIIGSLEHQEGM
jgi:ABC-type methionine transport system ATPase subunit